MKTFNELRLEALQECPKVFSSNYFNNILKQKGVQKQIILNAKNYNFLKRYCDNQFKGSKTWVKKQKCEIKYNTDETSLELKIKECANFLKKHGYKVYKQVVEYKEI